MPQLPVSLQYQGALTEEQKSVPGGELYQRLMTTQTIKNRLKVYFSETALRYHIIETRAD